MTAQISDEYIIEQRAKFTYELHPCRGFPGDVLPA